VKIAPNRRAGRAADVRSRAVTGSGNTEGATGRVALAGGCAVACLILAVPALAATIRGTSGPDRLVGTPQSDTLAGANGADTLIGKANGDTLRGARGADTLKPGPGEDVLKGGKGSDLLKARDGETDLVDCGRGQDTAIVDGDDPGENGVFDCEEVMEPAP
jgi:Ca2+-binding RTX toxin-like protein